jgi:hypothetical protein
LHLGLVLLLGTCIGKHELLPTLLRGAHRTLRPHEKVSTEASNLSKGEMCFNPSLSISFQVFITREQDLWAPRVLEPEAGSDLLQASPSHSRGELREHHMFVMPRPVYNTPGGRSRTSSSSTTSQGGGAINVSNFGGGHCRKSQQHPSGGPPSTSSTLVVVAVGPADSTPRGPTIDVFNFDGGHYQKS